MTIGIAMTTGIAMKTIRITTEMMNTGIMSITATGTVSEATGSTTTTNINSSGSALSPSKKGTESPI